MVRGPVPQGAVRPEGFVCPPPRRDQNLDLSQGVEDLPVAPFVPELVVEDIVVPAFLGASRFDEQGLDPWVIQPLPQGACPKLGAVVRADRAGADPPQPCLNARPIWRVCHTLPQTKTALRFPVTP